MKKIFGSKGSLIAAIFAAIAASLCCFGPLVLLLLGFSGAWIGTLTILEPYRIYTIGITLVFMGYAFYKLYIKYPGCELAGTCPLPKTVYYQRIIFWVIAVIILLLLTIPWYAQWLL